MSRNNFVDYANMQAILNGIEQKISGLGSQLTGIYTWASNTQYKIGDVVIENGSLFICQTVHTSSASFATDVANWVLFYADISPWLPNTYYVINACVIEDKKLYQCKTAHTSSTTFSATNWNLVAGGGGSSISTWVTSKQYNVDDIIIYANSIYKCNTTHTSSTFSTDASKWDLVYADLKNWASSVYYAVGTTVLYNNKIYTCDIAHTAASTFNATERANWTPLCTSVIKNWQASTTYDVDDMIMYNGSLFRCTTANTSSTFNASNFSLVTSDLKLWSASTNYVAGATAINGGLIYRCTATHVSGSTFDATEKANWSIIGKPCIYTWQTGYLYDVGDLISTNGSMYRCSTAHTAGSTFSGDIANWALVYTSVSNWSASNYYPVGACAIYNGILYQCTTAHTSTSTFADANWSNVGGKEYVQPYEDTPLGTIISFMGKTAPEDYLICDGTIYNISDYGDLADFINTQFGSYNFFGGNGTTTFAVPDLRGEFLRGTGTNSHANQGSGANVGVHQDGTEHTGNMFDKGTGASCVPYDGGASNWIMPKKPDKTLSSSSGSAWSNKSGNGGGSQVINFTSRPTNTSVLYCIKYTNAPSMQPSNIYSTTEKRIGTWIDGKALYQKTYDVGLLPNNTSKLVPLGVSIDKMIAMDGFAVATDNSGYTTGLPRVRHDAINQQIGVVYTGYTQNSLNIFTNSNASLLYGYVTIKYTKT